MRRTEIINIAIYTVVILVAAYAGWYVAGVQMGVQ